jgi:hypothetical protein
LTDFLLTVLSSFSLSSEVASAIKNLQKFKPLQI